MATADFSRIATNIGALNALQSMRNINAKLGIHQERLATGKRINSAMDDPAGLTIATKLNARSEGLKTALNNIGDAKNLLSVSESGLSRINDIVIQMRNKSEQAASDTLGIQERGAIVTQMKAYAAQIDDIVNQTTWNGTKLIDGNFNATFQTGADKNDTTSYDATQNVAAGVGGLNIATQSAGAATTTADANSLVTALSTVATSNANLNTATTGSYTLQVNYGATSIVAATVSLLDSNGNAVLIDADNLTTTDAVDTAITLANTTAATSIDFGNGLQVTIAAFSVASASYNATVSFTASGNYDLKSANVTTALSGNSTAADFSQYMADLDTSLGVVSGELSKVGALAGRLTFKEDQVSVAQINVESSYNRIMNADMAFEQLEATKYSILQQTAVTMLAQANMAPQGILSLFR